MKNEIKIFWNGVKLNGELQIRRMAPHPRGIREDAGKGGIEKGGPRPVFFAYG